MEMKSNVGNVIRLSVAQALSMTTMNVNIINTALVGSLVVAGTMARNARPVIAVCNLNANNFASVTFDG